MHGRGGKFRNIRMQEENLPAGNEKKYRGGGEGLEREAPWSRGGHQALNQICVKNKKKKAVNYYSCKLDESLYMF